MKLPKTPLSQTVTVKRTAPGHNDENGKWVEASPVLIMTIVNAIIAPLSGQERASASAAGFDSTYRLFAGSDDVTWEAGFSELLAGDIAIDAKGGKFIVTFPGDWSMLYTADLRAEP